MFAAFFYLLRQRGLNVSLNEWMTLLEGMEKGLHHSTLTGFYHLCRAVVVKSEAEFDRFDQVFLEFFKDVPYTGELPEDLLDWLNHPSEDLKRTIEDLRSAGFPDETLEELLKMLEERLKEQTEEHNGGNYWVGTQGRTPWGNSGWHPKGIRIGGQSRHRTAMMVAGERKFRDFRKDNTLDTRQFQVALRHLRQFSGLVDLPATEFDVDNTIKDTANNAGSLKVRYKKPRQNTVKVLLLMDSGGSMEYYSRLCSALFQAVSKSGHFKDLKVYYFHNCVYSRLYTEPTLRPSNTVPTDWVLSNLSSEYKVILVGDAQMAPHELVTQFRYRTPDGEEHKRCGLEWLQMLKGKYPHIVWLNPGDRPTWGEYWTRTYDTIGREFPMFPLTVDGLEAGMKKLLAR